MPLSLRSLGLLGLLLLLLFAFSSSVSAARIHPSRPLLSLRSTSLATTNSSNATSFAVPLSDPFYKVPSNVSSYSAGEVIRSRDIPTTVFGPDADRAWQVLYATMDGNGRADATVTTVVKPVNVSYYDRDGEKKVGLVAYGIPEDSGSINCAPSYVFAAANASLNAEEVTPDPGLYSVLYNGWYLTIPDFEGSRSQWLYGPTEGQEFLDGIRATLHFDSVNLTKHTTMTSMRGYSGGAHATGWAATLAPSYAPDLEILTWLGGGLPASMVDNFEYLDGSSASGLTFMGIVGAINSNETVKEYINSILLPNGTEAIELLSNGSACLPQAEVDYPYLLFASSTNVTAPVSDPVVHDYLVEGLLGGSQSSNTLGSNGIKAYLVHSQRDDVVPYWQAASYVNSQCSQGAKIHFASLAEGTHVHTEYVAEASFIDVLQQTFNNSKGYEGWKSSGSGNQGTYKTCDLTRYLEVPDVTSNQTQQLLGPTAYAVLTALLEVYSS